VLSVSKKYQMGSNPHSSNINAILIQRNYRSIDFLGGLVGTDSIFSTHGKEWQQQRSWFAPAFSLTHLLTLVPGMIEETLVFKEKLTQLAVSQKEFSMNDELTRLTIDVIGRSVGDIKLNSQSSYSGIQHSFEKAIDWCVGQANPWWQRALRPFMVRWYVYF
jgi:cytochrome P450